MLLVAQGISLEEEEEEVTLGLVLQLEEQVDQVVVVQGQLALR
jgi:hypothetical protein